MSTGLLFFPRSPILFRENRLFSTPGVARTTDPAPSVFYGVVRTTYLLRHGVAFSRYAKPDVEDIEIRETVWSEIGSPTTSGHLRVKGPFPYCAGQWLFPPPHNYFTGPYTAVPAAPIEAELTDLDEPAFVLRPLRLPEPAEAQPYQKWMTMPTLQTFLLEQAREEPAVAAYLAEHERHDWKEMDEFFSRETRFGHRRDPVTLRPKEEHLFSLQMIRADDEYKAGAIRSAAWAVVVDGIDCAALANGSAWLGGRSRRCDVAVAPEVPDFGRMRSPLQAALDCRARCFLYMATPAIFERGWRPHDFPGLRLVGAALRKAGAVGGWDVAANRAKPTHRTVPAGAVFFYEGNPDGGWADFIDAHQFGSISDDRPKAGFGIALVGVW